MISCIEYLSGYPLDTDLIKETLKQHQAYVQSHVPPEKLLIMDIKDGWKPLCEFLGKPVPNQPMPHANEAKSMERILPRMLLTIFAEWIAIFGIISCACYLAF